VGGRRLLHGSDWGDVVAAGARNFGFRQVRLETDGVHFRLGSSKKPKEAFVAWNGIAAVKHQQISTNQLIVVGKDGQSVGYTAYDIFRYKKIAREIATRAGLPLFELEPVKNP
jgi:hypothetical protein